MAATPAELDSAYAKGHIGVRVNPDHFGTDEESRAYLEGHEHAKAGKAKRDKAEHPWNQAAPDSSSGGKEPPAAESETPHTPAAGQNKPPAARAKSGRSTAGNAARKAKPATPPITSRPLPASLTRTIPVPVGGTTGGLLLAIVLYPLGLSVIRYGTRGPGLWFRAKFLNQEASAAQVAGAAGASAGKSGAGAVLGAAGGLSRGSAGGAGSGAVGNAPKYTF